MTANKASLQALFQTGDIPTGTDYSNFIDSCVNVAETSAQTVQSPLIITEVITPRVSATNVNVTGILSANVANIETLRLSAVSAASVNAVVARFGAGGTFTVSGGITASTDISANNVTVHGNLLATTQGFRGEPGVVSAAGTAQGTAASLIWAVNRCRGVTDGSATGFKILVSGGANTSNHLGLVQYVINETAASANLWPPTDGVINALATNAAFPIAANTMYTVIQRTTSAFSVK